MNPEDIADQFTEIFIETGREFQEWSIKHSRNTTPAETMTRFITMKVLAEKSIEQLEKQFNTPDAKMFNQIMEDATRKSVEAGLIMVKDGTKPDKEM
jgi:hypothetical protein